eukprot:TRINITY_DN4277_c0_g1_i1.p1 TRINITY_DN4277_c0_g1~~TRINITY_DN4277_c0_g1_i1.p1  ORF type:complete len:259 (-),score=54.30 TRINITY_DN4277_c0_g1_i1:144-920(-)
MESIVHSYKICTELVQLKEQRAQLAFRLSQARRHSAPCAGTSEHLHAHHPSKRKQAQVEAQLRGVIRTQQYLKYIYIAHYRAQHRQHLLTISSTATTTTVTTIANPTTATTTDTIADSTIAQSQTESTSSDSSSSVSVTESSSSNRSSSSGSSSDLNCPDNHGNAATPSPTVATTHAPTPTAVSIATTSNPTTTTPPPTSQHSEQQLLTEAIATRANSQTSCEAQHSTKQRKNKYPYCCGDTMAARPIVISIRPEIDA